MPPPPIIHCIVHSHTLTESSRSAHESSRDALLKQVQSQYDAAVRQLTKLQSDAREAFEREDAANAELVRTRNELQRALREVQVLSCSVCGISAAKRDLLFFSLRWKMCQDPACARTDLVQCDRVRPHLIPRVHI